MYIYIPYIYTPYIYTPYIYTPYIYIHHIYIYTPSIYTYIIIYIYVCTPHILIHGEYIHHLWGAALDTASSPGLPALDNGQMAWAITALVRRWPGKWRDHKEFLMDFMVISLDLMVILWDAHGFFRDFIDVLEIFGDFMGLQWDFSRGRLSAGFFQ